MKVRPLGDRLIVRAIEDEETTESGIVLPDTAKEKPQKGRVLAVGDGKLDEDTGKRAPLDVSEGDEVLYSKYGGTEIKVDGEDLMVLRESDVVAVVGRDANARSEGHKELLEAASTSDVAGLRRGVEEDIRRLYELAK
jgi:chaperonin GroES